MSIDSPLQPPLEEDVPRPVIARGIDHPDGHVVAPHHHRRGQLLYGSTGIVMAATPDGAWMMPPQRGLPDRCRVVGISPLMRSLLTEAVTIAAEYDLDGRDGALMALVLHEIRRLPPLPLALPFPAQPALARRCRAFVLRPTSHDTIDDWCESLGLSRRTFTRLFRRETGLSFIEWRQQACLMAAVPRLAVGKPVTAIAIDLDYDNPAAFTAMFKRVLGASPRAYRNGKG